LQDLPKILDGLEAAGVVAYAGRGRGRQVQLHHQHPLLNALGRLFDAEAARWRAVQYGLWEIIQAHASSMVSVWIEGPVATGCDRFSDPIAVGVLADAPLSHGICEQLQKRFNTLQAQHHIVIAAQYYQRADLEGFTPARRAILDQAVLIYGPAPQDLSTRPPVAGMEQSRDSIAAGPRKRSRAERPREIGDLVATKLTEDPELIVRARQFINRRLAVAGDTERLSLLEWKGLVDSLSPGQVAAMLREESARAHTLRQTLPFVSVLTDPERTAIVELADSSTVKPRKHTRRS
jgi:hypothetical protein